MTSKKGKWLLAKEQDQQVCYDIINLSYLFLLQRFIADDQVVAIQFWSLLSCWHASSENSSGNFKNLAAIFKILWALFFTIWALLVRNNSLYWKFVILFQVYFKTLEGQNFSNPENVYYAPINGLPQDGGGGNPRELHSVKCMWVGNLTSWTSPG